MEVISQFRYLRNKLCVILFEHSVECFTSQSHYIWSRVHSFDHVTDAISHLGHASNTNLQLENFFAIRYSYP